MAKTKLGPSTFLYPKPTLLVGAMVNGKPNFMTASWSGIEGIEVDLKGCHCEQSEAIP